MQQGKRNGGMYALMLLVLAGSGLNLNTTGDINTSVKEINKSIGDIREWKAVTEYRITELEKLRSD